MLAQLPMSGKGELRVPTRDVVDACRDGHLDCTPSETCPSFMLSSALGLPPGHGLILILHIHATIRLTTIVIPWNCDREIRQQVPFGPDAVSGHPRR